jgi:hypothetical protein
MNVWSNRRLCFGASLTDVYEDLLKKEGGGDDLILPKQVEDVKLDAERYESAERLGPRYATCIHDPPADGADAAPTEEDVDKANAKHPQTEATEKTTKNFTIYGCGVPPPSVEPGM